MFPVLDAITSLPPTTTLGEGMALPADSGLGGDTAVFTGESPVCWIGTGFAA